MLMSHRTHFIISSKVLRFGSIWKKRLAWNLQAVLAKSLCIVGMLQLNRQEMYSISILGVGFFC